MHGGGDAFLSRALAVVGGVIKRDADERTAAFNARPFLRLLVGGGWWVHPRTGLAAHPSPTHSQHT